MSIFWGIIEILLGLGFIYRGEDMRKNPTKNEKSYAKQITFYLFGKGYAKKAIKERVRDNARFWPFFGVALIIAGILELFGIL